jgi:c(7)-type cytochrome triheme protein
MALLQQPAEALSVLPSAYQGNQVDWAAALRQGHINPRTNIYPETKVQILDLDILMEDTAGIPMVLFPHRPHTEWLDCKNCHDNIFIAKRGANNISMIDLLEGRFCGRCHGAVSFPLTQCVRCHSVPRDGNRPAARQGAR